MVVDPSILLDNEVETILLEVVLADKQLYQFFCYFCYFTILFCSHYLHRILQQYPEFAYIFLYRNVQSLVDYFIQYVAVLWLDIVPIAFHLRRLSTRCDD